MWYNPQHSMSAALGAARHADRRCRAACARRLARSLLAGVVLALSTTFNPLIGGCFPDLRCGRRRRCASHSPDHAAAAPRARGCARRDCRRVVYQQRYGRGRGWRRPLRTWRLRRNRPVMTLMLSLGPLLVPALLGMWPPGETAARGVAVGRGHGARLAGVLFHQAVSEGSYIGFRAGQLLQLALPGLAALFFARLWRRSARAPGGVATRAA